jgi:hypothetical protein
MEAAAILPSIGKATFWSSDLERRSFLAACVDPEPGFFPAAEATIDNDRDLFPVTNLTADDFRRIDEAFEAWRLTQPSPAAPHAGRSGGSGRAARIWSLIRGS